MGLLFDLLLEWIGGSAADHAARKMPPWGCAVIMLSLVAGITFLLFWLGSH